MIISKPKVLITGAEGFIGKNLIARLSEMGTFQLITFIRGEDGDSLREKIDISDIVIHLAGENKTLDSGNFERNNTDLTNSVCEFISKTRRNIPLIFSSSIQVSLNNPYGKSKLASEQKIEQYIKNTGNTAVIFRLPGVFGKWAKPNYNSVVSTFCFNISRSLPIKILDPERILDLVYIDNLIDRIIEALDIDRGGMTYANIKPTYQISVKELASQIVKFREDRDRMYVGRVGDGFVRALYSTYISYLPREAVSSSLFKYNDDRGSFVEMLKTPDCGQFSYFTIRPKVTRGSHYHHTKTEKFLVVCGTVVMRFRSLTTGEKFDFKLSSDKPEVVDSIPGWVHDITNVGNNDAIVMLWANEVFDPGRPDCIPCKV